MTLEDILLEDAKRSFLTRKQRQAIRNALNELRQLRKNETKEFSGSKSFKERQSYRKGEAL